MRKVQLIITIFALLAQYALAQEEQATVYLNNGSILKGMLAKSNNAGKYRITIPNGSIIYFTGKDVKNIINGQRRDAFPQPSSRDGEEATAYLLNGSVIKGLVRKSSTSDNYRAVFPDGSIFFFPENMLKSIEYEQAAKWIDGNGDVLAQDERTANRVLLDPSTRRITGYRGFLDAGWTFGFGKEYYKRGDYSEYITGYLEITTSHGGQINPYLFLGAGVGIQDYIGLEESELLLLYYIDMRVNLVNTERVPPVSPFFKIQLGSITALQDDFLNNLISSTLDDNTLYSSGGFYRAAYFGVKFMIGNRAAINFHAGYSYTSVFIHGVNLKLGFEF